MRIRKIYAFLTILVFNSLNGQFYSYNYEGELSFCQFQTSEWRDIDKTEVGHFFSENGIRFVEEKQKGSQVIVVGEFINVDCPNQISLIFEKDQIVGIKKRTYYVARCYEMISKKLDPEIFKSTIEIGRKLDLKVYTDFVDNFKIYFAKNKSLETQIIGETTLLFDFKRVENVNIYQFGAVSIDRGFWNFEIIEEMELAKQKYIINGVDLMSLNTENVEKMVEIFLDDCKMNGLNVPGSKISIEFCALEKGVLGLAFGKDDDSVIKIKIDRMNWINSSTAFRWYVLYHELGHDVLNLEHGKGGRMMDPISDRGYSWFEFWEDRQAMFRANMSRP